MLEVTMAERGAIIRLLRKLDPPYPIASLGDKKIYWHTPGFGGQASYRWWSDSLYIEPLEITATDSLRHRVFEELLPNRIPAIAHELRHAQQFRDWGIIRYALNNLPIIQNWKMEKEAYAVENTAYVQLGL